MPICARAADEPNSAGTAAYRRTPINSTRSAERLRVQHLLPASASSIRGAEERMRFNGTENASSHPPVCVASGEATESTPEFAAWCRDHP